MWLWCVRLGRRRSMIAYYAVAGVALVLSQVIPEQAGDWDRLTCVITIVTSIGPICLILGLCITDVFTHYYEQFSLLCTLPLTWRMHRCLCTNSWTSLAENLTDLTTFAIVVTVTSRRSLPLDITCQSNSNATLWLAATVLSSWIISDNVTYATEILQYLCNCFIQRRKLI